MKFDSFDLMKMYLCAPSKILHTFTFSKDAEIETRKASTSRYFKIKSDARRYCDFLLFQACFYTFVTKLRRLHLLLRYDWR